MRSTRGLSKAIAAEALLLSRTRTVGGALVLCMAIAIAAVLPPLNINAQSAPAVMHPSATGAGTSVASVSETGSDVWAQMIDVAPFHVHIPQEVVELPPLPVSPKHHPWNQRGVFLTPNSISSESYRTKTIDLVRRVGGNAIIFDVKGSAVHFDAKSAPLAKELGLIDGKYDVKEVVNILHENGLYAIARYIAIKDHSLTKALPETNIRDPRTGRKFSPGWIDPANDKALEYNRQIICELAASGIDEINLDYIRYATDDGALQEAFSGEEKIAKIEAFIKMARYAIDACGPNTKLGVSTFSILGWDYEANVEGLGQDVVRFAPMLDVISPMAYNANFSLENYGDPTGERNRWYYLVYQTVKGYREKLGPEHAWKVRPWLQGWEATSGQIHQQMNATFDAGACGFLMWNAGNSYALSYDAMRKITVPESCRHPVN